MRVLVCGGRLYIDRLFVYSSLDHLDWPDKQIKVIIQGGANGADALARDWAETRGREIITYPADWSLGKRAGPLRNQKMLDEGKPDLVVAFPGGRGTADMVHRAWIADIPVRKS